MLFKIVDISASGILVSSHLDILEKIKLYAELPIKSSILCTAKIVRKEESKEGFYYGCMLLDIGKDKTDRIRQFVFKKQIEEYKSKPFLKVIDF